MLNLHTDIEFEYGVVDRLSPLIRRVIANNPSPFTFTGTGTYIIGNGNVAVIDPGPLLDEHVEAILDALEPDERVSHILVTHTHLDHSPACTPLRARTNAPIYGCPPPKPETFDAPRLEEDADDAFNPDHIVADGDIINGADWTLEAVATPGHMANHFCYALREEKTLFTGDHVMGWSTSIIAPPDGNMQDYMASLSRLLTRDDELYWPTHGPCIPNPKEFVKGYIQHRQNREKQVLERLSAGDTSITTMVEVMYADVDKKLHPAAALSVFAHMQDLVARKRVSCSGTPALDSEFTLV